MCHMTKNKTHFNFIDRLESQVGEAEDDVGSPQGEMCDWVSFWLHKQMVKMAQTRQPIQLVQVVDVGRVEHYCLQVTLELFKFMSLTLSDSKRVHPKRF